MRCQICKIYIFTPHIKILVLIAKDVQIGYIFGRVTLCLKEGVYQSVQFRI